MNQKKMQENQMNIRELLLSPRTTEDKGITPNMSAHQVQLPKSKVPKNGMKRSSDTNLSATAKIKVRNVPQGDQAEIKESIVEQSPTRSRISRRVTDASDVQILKSSRM